MVGTFVSTIILSLHSDKSAVLLYIELLNNLNSLQRSIKEKTLQVSSNGGILNGSLQMIHVHVLPVTPLGADHRAQMSTD